MNRNISQAGFRRAICAALLIWSSCFLLGQTSVFQYQGRLLQSGQPANGTYDIIFRLADSASQGNFVGGPITNSAVLVSNGSFRVALDFGSPVFDGSPRWLEIGVRAHGSASPFVLLNPRQAIVSTPYAIYSGTASRAALATNLAGGGATLTNIPASSLVGVVPSGAIANITSNQIDKATDAIYRSGISNRMVVINVKDYGAKGDGRDDTDAIARAWEAFRSPQRAGSATLYFPAGIYVDYGAHSISFDSVVQGRSSQTILGDGMRSIWWCLSTANRIFLKSKGTPINLEKIVLRGPGKYSGKVTGYVHDGPYGVFYIQSTAFWEWSDYAMLSDDAYSVVVQDIYLAKNNIGLGLGYKSDGWDITGKADGNNVGLEIGADTGINYPLIDPGEWRTPDGGLQSQSIRVRLNCMNNFIGILVGGSETDAVDISGYGEDNATYVQVGHDPGNPYWPTNAVENNHRNEWNEIRPIFSVNIHDLCGTQSVTAAETNWPAAIACDGPIKVYHRCRLSLSRNSLNAGCSPTFVSFKGDGVKSTVAVDHFGVPKGFGDNFPMVNARKDAVLGRGQLFQGPSDIWNWPVPNLVPYVVDVASGAFNDGYDYGAFRSAFWFENLMGPGQRPVSEVTHRKSGSGKYVLNVSNADLNVSGGHLTVPAGAGLGKVLTSDPLGRASWANPVPGAEVFRLHDEFIGGTAAAGDVGELRWGLASGTLKAQPEALYPHWGNYDLITGASANAFAGLSIPAPEAASSYSFAGLVSQSNWQATFIFKLPDTNQAKARIGFVDAPNSSSPGGAIGLRFDPSAGSKFTFESRALGNSLTADSSVPADLEWHKLLITHNGVSLQFAIDGEAPKYLPPPAGVTSLAATFQVQTLDSTPKRLRVDLFDFVISGVPR